MLAAELIAPLVVANSSLSLDLTETARAKAAAARAEVAMGTPPPPTRAGTVPVCSPRQVAGRQAALAQLAAIRSGGAASPPAP